MKKNTLVLILLLLFTIGISSQEVISSQGNSYANANGSIDFTIGEVVITTLINTNNILTQGFHQTNLTVLGVDDFDLSYQAKVFPNPTRDFLQVEIQNFEGLNYKLYDIRGRELVSSKIDQQNIALSLSSFAKGLYLFVILNENNQKLKTYRIIKN